jgi:hypothetical protein
MVKTTLQRNKYFQTSLLTLRISAGQKTFDISDKLCLDYISAISNMENPFHWLCLFCIFVKNTIYAVLIEVLTPVVLARSHKY